MTFIDELELAYADRLSVLAEYGFEVEVLPDSRKDHDRPATRGRITVSYAATRYGDKTSPGLPEINAMGLPVQEKFMSFSIIVESDLRRGRSGCYEGITLAEQVLVGFEPAPGFGRTTMLTSQFIDYQSGFYSYELVVQTTMYIVPSITMEGQMGGLTEADYPPVTAALFAEGIINNQ